MVEPQHLLDSSICTYVLADAGGPTARRLGEREAGTVGTSAIAYAEVMRGRAGQAVKASAGVAALFTVVPVLPFNCDAALRYREVHFRRGTFDRLIAAHALSLDLTLVTNDERDYADVPGFRIENWTPA